MSRKVYEAMEWHIEIIWNYDSWYYTKVYTGDEEKVIRLGDVLEWIDKRWHIECSKYDWEWASDCRHNEVVELRKHILDIRPKDHLSKSIPLDPDESRRPLLEFLSSLIE